MVGVHLHPSSYSNFLKDLRLLWSGRSLGDFFWATDNNKSNLVCVAYFKHHEGFPWEFALLKVGKKKSVLWLMYLGAFCAHQCNFFLVAVINLPIVGLWSWFKTNEVSSGKPGLIFLGAHRLSTQAPSSILQYWELTGVLFLVPVQGKVWTQCVIKPEWYLRDKRQHIPWTSMVKKNL